MANPFVGEIRLFGGNFAPSGWAFCDGQLLAIADNEALFSLIGTTYGGNGQTTFALPDLRGRVPVHQAPSFVIGSSGGQEQVTLTTVQLPAHGHPLLASSADGTTSDPTSSVFAENDARSFSTAAPSTTLHASALTTTGGGQPHDNRMPYLALNFIISLFGVFPSQN
jgi:microcystin-dependent protein